MKGKIKRKHPAFWLIRHRSGNIRDHPQRYHVNIGKRYTTGNFRNEAGIVSLRKTGSIRSKWDSFSGKNVLTEREVRLMLRRLNNGRLNPSEIDFPEDGFALTPEQVQKGYKWLINKWRTPTGKERKNNPFGYREEHVLENFKTIRFVDLYDTANYYSVSQGFHFYVPVYRVEAKDGSHFDYYVSGGEVNIIG